MLCNIVLKLREVFSSINSLLSFSIRNFFKELEEKKIEDYRVWTDVISISFDILNKKLDFYLGKIKIESKDREEKRKKKESRESDRSVEKRRKTKEEWKREVEEGVEVDLTKILSIRIGKRVRNAFLSDLYEALLDISKKIEKKKEKGWFEKLMIIIRQLYEEIINLINRYKKLAFSSIIKNKNRREIVISFSTVLHLSVEDRVELYQEKLFDELWIISKNGKK